MNAPRLRMRRYLVERSFPKGLAIPMDEEGCRACASLVAVNGSEGVFWLHSYASLDQRKVFCIYDAPSPEAIRKAAERNGMPVDTITPVTVLDPYFYLPK